MNTESLMPVRYYLQIDPQWTAQAVYAIGLLLEGAGFLFTATTDITSASLVYSYERPVQLPEQAVWIRAESASDWGHPVPNVAWMGKLPYLCPEARASIGAEADNCIPIDIVYSTFVLATGMLEQEQKRDAWGVVVARDSFLDKAGLLGIPVVSLYSGYLAVKLRRQYTDLAHLPRWPEGKSYAVVISHDVDVPFWYRDGAYYRHALQANWDGGAWLAAMRSLAGIAIAGPLARLGFLPSAEHDPNFCFDEWLELERKIPAASCFYVAVTTFAEPSSSPQDVSYDFRHPAITRALNKAIAGGWEIGLHASINAKLEPERFQLERRRLESRLDHYSLKGLRHHYLALDPDLPEHTLWSQARAGFEYDSSLGFNDLVGFRRGIAWPFQPFDREQGQPIPILEIPLTLMDRGAFDPSNTRDGAYQKIQDHFEQVRKCGGMVVLDWHLENMNPARLQGASRVMVRILDEWSKDKDIFWSTPAQMSDWWQERRKRLSIEHSH